jgi:GNAT superfamily N-acetyltransferase
VLGEALHAPAPGDVFLIAEDEHGERSGFVYAVAERDFFTGEPYLHVSEIATVRSGGGAGAALMGAAETRARERGYRFVTLNVVDENAAARRFYERHGYAIGHHHFVKRF